MKIKYFTDTDTLLMEFKDAPVVETRDLDENTILTSTLKAMSARSRSSTPLNAPAHLASHMNR